MKLGCKKRDFTWFIEGRPMGTHSALGNFNVGNFFEPEAHHWFCPRCGRVWAMRVPVNPSWPCFHRALHSPCARCGATGSLRLSREELDNCPKEVLQYETLIAAANPEAWRVMSRSLNPAASHSPSLRF